VAELAKLAQILGWTGIAITDNWHSLERIEQLKEQIAATKSKIELYPGVKLQPADPTDLKRLLNTVRPHVAVVVVHGGDYAINRAACSDRRVDILAHPELGRLDSGLDDVAIRAAAQNNVAIQVNFRQILYVIRKSRSAVLNHIATNIRLAQAMRAPLIACSGALSKFELRDPRALVAMVNVLNGQLPVSFAAVSDVPISIIKRRTK
jgi:RNase P/RNase MRP subunit p30